jgi:hypothetical protein
MAFVQNSRPTVLTRPGGLPSPEPLACGDHESGLDAWHWHMCGTHSQVGLLPTN